MAKSISDEEIQLRKRARRRLVGAVVLVLLVVVFLPMVLDRKPKPVVQNIAIRIPARDINDFASLPGTGGGAASPAVSPKPAVATAVKEAPKKVLQKAPKKVPQKAVEPRQPRTEPAKAAKVGKSEAPHKLDMFVVQIGAFSRPDNAKRMLANLSAHRVKCYSETVKTASGKKTRVRAGPFRTKEEAEKVQARLHALGIKGGEVMPQDG